MKKIIILVLVFFLTTAFSLSAQSNMSFGVKGGISLSHFTGENWDDFVESNDGESKMRLGFSAGGFFL